MTTNSSSQNCCACGQSDAELNTCLNTIVDNLPGFCHTRLANGEGDFIYSPTKSQVFAIVTIDLIKREFIRRFGVECYLRHAHRFVDRYNGLKRGLFVRDIMDIITVSGTQCPVTKRIYTKDDHAEIIIRRVNEDESVLIKNAKLGQLYVDRCQYMLSGTMSYYVGNAVVHVDSRPRFVTLAIELFTPITIPGIWDIVAAYLIESQHSSAIVTGASFIAAGASLIPSSGIMTGAIGKLNNF